MYDILIKSDSRYPLNRNRIRERLMKELAKYRLNRKLEISVLVVGSRKMRALNKQYRDLDEATNVLSFPLEQAESQGKGFVFPQNKKLYLGDIVICYPIARKQAGQYSMFVDDWIADLAAHGLKHLLGIHHD